MRFKGIWSSDLIFYQVFTYNFIKFHNILCEENLLILQLQGSSSIATSSSVEGMIRVLYPIRLVTSCRMGSSTGCNTSPIHSWEGWNVIMFQWPSAFLGSHHLGSHHCIFIVRTVCWISQLRIRIFNYLLLFPGTAQLLSRVYHYSTIDFTYTFRVKILML